MAEVDRRADAEMFGIDFQVNAAIVLFLENVKDAKSLRMEGEEDIDLNLNDGRKILAQAKSVQRPREDFRNVRANLRKALQSLSEAAAKNKVKELIFITNSPNPFNEEHAQFYGASWQSFADLTEHERNLIEKYLADIHNPLDTSLFKLQILPFATSDDRERYKIVKQSIDDFLLDDEMRIYGNISTKTLMNIWQSNMMGSGTKKDRKITLSKRELIWPIIVMLIDTEDLPDEFFEDYDEPTYDEVLEKYKELIYIQSERFNFTTQVLNDYFDFSRSPHNWRRKVYKFINANWKRYQEELKLDSFEPELRELLIKVILYRILSNYRKIKHVKEGVNL